MKRLGWFLLPCATIFLGGCEDGSTSTGSNSAKPSVTSSNDAPRKGDAFVVPDPLIAMLWCPPGTFHMGSPEVEPSRDGDEVLRAVTLASGFWLGKYEVTQAQWQRIMGNNPSHFKGAKLPVEKISWAAAKSFCAKLTERERNAGRLPAGWAYQLPTEAQWEYACRAGTNSAWSFGNTPQDIDKRINFADKSSNMQGAQKEYDDGFEFTAPGGSFPANPWGFHEMHGNVFEWCSDWYGKNDPVPARDPVGPSSGSEKVFRGGSWALPTVFSRSARRDKNQPILESAFLGLRVCLSRIQNSE